MRVATPPPPPPAPVATQPLTDGELIEVAGTRSVYRLVGGAPLFVRFWQDIGGPQPVITVTAAQFAALRAAPADGSVVDTQAGDGYIVVGGYPFALPGDAPAGSLLIDGWDLYHLGSPLAHLDDTPADGTVVEGQPSGSHWVFNGGRRAPAPASGSATAVSDDALAGWPIDCAADPAGCQSPGDGNSRFGGAAQLAADPAPAGLATR